MDSRKLEDCFYFLNGGCTNTACFYRHNSISRASDKYCPGWQQFTCYDINCPQRHTAIPVHKPSKHSGISGAPQKRSVNANKSTGKNIDIPAVEATDIHVPPTSNSNSKTIGKARAICKYHLHGKCTRGDSCSFLHSSSRINDKPQICQKEESTGNPTDAPTLAVATPSEYVALSCNPSSDSSSHGDVGQKRKGRDILDKYSFKKSIKADKQNNKCDKSTSDI
mmetsp:Transcript_19190/g.32131  ORF Transcript_19190/g.32131 Transcript_19190/m.32131 type:complete len:223 (-) Transcript_19190:125-793(-)